VQEATPNPKPKIHGQRHATEPGPTDMPSKIHAEQPLSHPTMHQLVSKSLDDENPQTVSNPVQSHLNFEQSQETRIVIRRDAISLGWK
jgi:hypothetical protein